MELILSENQFNLVYNSFSFVIACMGAAFLFFLLVRSKVAPRHRMAAPGVEGSGCRRRPPVLPEAPLRLEDPVRRRGLCERWSQSMNCGGLVGVQTVAVAAPGR